MKNTTMRFGLIFFAIAIVLMSIAAVLEATAKQQDSVSGFMILSVYAQAPWSFIPQFTSLSQHISDSVFKLVDKTWVEYAVNVLITGLCWFLNGTLIGLVIQAMGAKKV